METEMKARFNEETEVLPLRAWCAGCGNPLEIVVSGRDVQVVPCPVCLAARFAAGQLEGMVVAGRVYERDGS